MSHRPHSTRSLLLSLGIIAAAVGTTYGPVLGRGQQTVLVISGTELQEPLQVLETRFEEAYPDIQLDLKFQGSQDIVNNYINDQNDEPPAILIPANGELLDELSDRWSATQSTSPFQGEPQPIATTMLVGVTWPDRGDTLFPQGRFDWSRVEQALNAGNWSAVGGSNQWGSFDFVMTDPTRSNSGQLTLSLWAQTQQRGDRLDASKLLDPQFQSLVNLVKRSVYLPPPSTDTLLQEFIARGPNDADVAMVYESIALYRWQQSATTQGQPYQIYYLDPTIETTSTAAIVTRDVNTPTIRAAEQFLEFITQDEQQAVFVQFGFRPMNDSIDLQAVPNSPWSQNIPGAEVNPKVETIPMPDRQTVSEIIRQWQRAN